MSQVSRTEHTREADDDLEPGSPHVLTYTLSHRNKTYINLESIEPLLQPRDRWCSEPYGEDHSKYIRLPFHDASHYAAAKNAWQGRDDIYWVLEHESCFEGRHERSVYAYVGHSISVLVLFAVMRLMTYSTKAMSFAHSSNEIVLDVVCISETGV